MYIYKMGNPVSSSEREGEEEVTIESLKPLSTSHVHYTNTLEMRCYSLTSHSDDSRAHTVTNPMLNGEDCHTIYISRQR